MFEFVVHWRDMILNNSKTYYIRVVSVKSYLMREIKKKEVIRYKKIGWGRLRHKIYMQQGESISVGEHEYLSL